jgi:hypothetical protein
VDGVHRRTGAVFFDEKSLSAENYLDIIFYILYFIFHIKRDLSGRVDNRESSTHHLISKGDDPND